MLQIFVPKYYTCLCLKHDSLVLSKPQTEESNNWKPIRFGDWSVLVSLLSCSCFSSVHFSVCTKTMRCSILTFYLDFDLDLFHLLSWLWSLWEFQMIWNLPDMHLFMWPMCPIICYHTDCHMLGHGYPSIIPRNCSLWMFRIFQYLRSQVAFSF